MMTTTNYAFPPARVKAAPTSPATSALDRSRLSLAAAGALIRRASARVDQGAVDEAADTLELALAAVDRALMSLEELP